MQITVLPAVLGPEVEGYVCVCVYMCCLQTLICQFIDRFLYFVFLRQMLFIDVSGLVPITPPSLLECQVNKWILWRFFTKLPTPNLGREASFEMCSLCNNFGKKWVSDFLRIHSLCCRILNYFSPEILSYKQRWRLLAGPWGLCWITGTTVGCLWADNLRFLNIGKMRK